MNDRFKFRQPVYDGNTFLRFNYWGRNVNDSIFASPNTDHMAMFKKDEQCSGLKDRNDKLIYEGDILHGREEGNGETTAWTDAYYIVFYNKQDGCWSIREKHETEDSCWGNYLHEIIDYYEIIGNIHENPELSET